MAPIQSQDALHFEALGDGNDGGISKVDVLVAVLMEHRGNPLMVMITYIAIDSKSGVIGAVCQNLIGIIARSSDLRYNSGHGELQSEVTSRFGRRYVELIPTRGWSSRRSNAGIQASCACGN